MKDNHVVSVLQVSHKMQLSFCETLAFFSSFDLHAQCRVHSRETYTLNQIGFDMFWL